MTKSSMAVPGQYDVTRDHDALARDSRYAHFVRIPDRICRCLDYFEVTFDRAVVKQRLYAYYIFIAVVDEVLDSAQLEVGREVLNHLAGREPSPEAAANTSQAWLVTQVLQGHIESEVNSLVNLKFEELYRAVIRERNSRTLARYVEERRNVGRLTAELSYLLIRPLLECGRDDPGNFLQDVGEVGCLVDSSIDLRADHRLGLLSFTPTLTNHLQLIWTTLQSGLKISLRHPRLFGLFLEAIGDNCLDQLRSLTRTGAGAGSEAGESRIGVSGSTSEVLSNVAWTKP